MCLRCTESWIRVAEMSSEYCQLTEENMEEFSILRLSPLIITAESVSKGQAFLPSPLFWFKKKKTAKGKRSFWFSPQGLVLLYYVLMLWSTRLVVAAEIFGTKAGHAEPTVQAPRHQGQVEVWPPHSMLTGQGARQTPPSCCCTLLSSQHLLPWFLS